MCLKVALGSSQEWCCPVLFGITELALVFSERERLEWRSRHVRELGSERNMMRQKCDGPKLGQSSGSQWDIFVPQGTFRNIWRHFGRQSLWVETGMLLNPLQ